MIYEQLKTHRFSDLFLSKPDNPNQCKFLIHYRNQDEFGLNPEKYYHQQIHQSVSSLLDRSFLDDRVRL